MVTIFSLYEEFPLVSLAILFLVSIGFYQVLTYFYRNIRFFYT